MSENPWTLRGMTRRSTVVAAGCALWVSLAGSPLAAEEEPWQSAGPMCTSVTSLATAPSVTDVSYMSVAGRFFRSDNGWQSWQELQADNLNFSTNGHIAYDPRNPSTVFAVIDGEVQGSDDGGVTFSLLPDPQGQLFGARGIWLVPSDPAVLLVYAWDLWFRSVDMGQTWVDVSATDGDVPGHLILHPALPDSLWAFGLQGVWRTDDLGDSWRRITDGFAGFPSFSTFSLDPADPQTAYLTEGTELFVTTDGGQQWQSKGNVPVSTSFPETAAAVGDGVLLVANSTGLLRSNDGGETWGPAGLEGEEVQYLEWLQESALLLATTEGGFAVSEDGGLTWDWPSQGINHSSISTVAWAGDDSSTLFAGLSCGRGRVVRSDDGGLTWKQGQSLVQSLGISAIGIDPNNPDRIFAGGGTNGMYVSNDGGVSWTFRLVTSDFSNINSPEIIVHPSDSQRILVASEEGLYLSRDGGETWENRLPNVSVPAIAVDPTDPDVVLLNSGWRSTDRGDTWRQGDNFPTLVSVLVYDRLVPGQVFAGTIQSSVGLQRSRDGGVTWQPLAGSPVGQANALVQDSDGNFWLSARDEEVPADRLWRSGDGGMTWQRHEEGILRFRNRNGEPPFYTSFAANTAGGVAVGTVPFGVYRLGAGPGCIPGDTVACLLDGQFRVEGTMETLTSPPTTVETRVMEFPSARAESDQAVFFESFQPGNFEVGVKMVDACILPEGHPLRAFWAFFGGLTNAETAIEIQDSASGEVFRWENPRGDLALSLGDTNAFPCEIDNPPPTLPCVPNDTTACLLAERFRVTGQMVGFDDPPTAVPVRVMSFAGGRAESDQAVFFESFQEGNFEVGVKMVDACMLPPGDPLRAYWVFYGGLSNAETHIRVTQISTGEVDEWFNEAGSFPRSEGRTQAFACEP